MGDKTKPLCVLGNTTPTVLGKNSKSVPQTTCLVEQAVQHNLPQGIVVNWCLVNPRSKVVPIIYINSNNYNIWIRQPLLAAELYTFEYHPWEYETIIDQDGNEINTWLQVIPPSEIMTSLHQVSTVKWLQTTTCRWTSPSHIWSYAHDIKSKDFDFQTEVNRLPFKLHLDENVHLSSQQAHFIATISNNQEVLLVHSEDLGYCY